MVSGAAKRLIAAALLACATHSAHGDDAPIRLYTHGDTYPAQWSERGGISGIAIDVATCAFGNLGQDVVFELAPLSRATELMSTQDHAVWYPSILAGDEERMARLVGPVSQVELMWYFPKTAKYKPSDEGFREHAKVTAYTGSRTEVMLKDEGYSLVPGSADHMRLVHLLVSGSVDAVLAVDFRWKLPTATNRLVAKHMDLALYKSFPVAYQVSRPLAEREPDFIERFQDAVDTCKVTANAEGAEDRTPAH